MFKIVYLFLVQCLAPLAGLELLAERLEQCLAPLVQRQGMKIYF